MALQEDCLVIDYTASSSVQTTRLSRSYTSDSAFPNFERESLAGSSRHYLRRIVFVWLKGSMLHATTPVIETKDNSRAPCEYAESWRPLLSSNFHTKNGINYTIIIKHVSNAGDIFNHNLYHFSVLYYFCFCEEYAIKKYVILIIFILIKCLFVIYFIFIFMPSGAHFVSATCVDELLAFFPSILVSLQPAYSNIPIKATFAYIARSLYRLLNYCRKTKGHSCLY